MALIHVARGGTNMGSFPLEEIREGLRTGRFLPTDVAWEEGMPDWRPLSQIMAGKPGAAGPAVDPAGAALPTTSGAGLPWEHREQLGFWKAYVDTVVTVLTKPGEAFAMMKTEGDMTGPLLFALIGGCAGIIVSVLVQLALHSIGFMADRQSAMFGIGMVGIWSLAYILFAPVLVAIGVFIGSGILHLCLMIVGGAKKSFETTFRVVCFTSGSTYLLSMIPFCGGMIAMVWNIVVEIIGLARAHETETGKAVMAVLLPIIVCCGGFILLAILGGFSALTLFQKH
jgi:hypothetical protein